MSLKKIVIITIGLIFIQGCTGTNLPESEHAKTTKMIMNLENEGDRLEIEGKEKLHDLVGTLNQTIN